MPSSSDLVGPAPARPLTVVGAFREGWRRALGAPALAVVATGLALAVTLPIAGTRGLAVDLPSVANAVVGDLPGLVTFPDPWRPLADPGRSSAAAVLVTAAIGLAVLGGLIDRLARARVTGLSGFAAACRRYAGRFFRIGLLMLPVDVALFSWLRTAGAVRGAVVVAVLLAAHVVADLARIRAVVEDRRSAIGAVAAGARFARRRAGRMTALVLLHLIVPIGLVALWPVVAGAGPGATGAWALGLVAVGLWSRLAMLGSSAAFFQAELAHAGAAASAEPLWPDAPEAAAVTRGR
jgi:hypothetical protein